MLHFKLEPTLFISFFLGPIISFHPVYGIVLNLTAAALVYINNDISDIRKTAAIGIGVIGLYLSYSQIKEHRTYRVRIGSVCEDGWNSNATGRGACSHHGGVDHWIYEERKSSDKD